MGIGRAIEVNLATVGYVLVLVARRADALAELAGNLRVRSGAQVQVLPANLGSTEGVALVLNTTAGADVGLCVAATGYGTSGPLLVSQLKDKDDLLRVNCEAVLRPSHALGNCSGARGSGGLVLNSLIVRFQGAPWAAFDAATKAYVQSLAGALHVELPPVGIDVLTVAPGPMHSGLADRTGMTMGRALTPHTVARGTLNALS